jgi:hypothetical protein
LLWRCYAGGYAVTIRKTVFRHGRRTKQRGRRAGGVRW